MHYVFTTNTAKGLACPRIVNFNGSSTKKTKKFIQNLGNWTGHLEEVWDCRFITGALETFSGREKGLKKSSLVRVLELRNLPARYCYDLSLIHI